MKITSAAIKFSDGTTSTGYSHANAADNCRLNDGSEEDQAILMLLIEKRYTEGFMTSEGTFVLRVEAHKIAKEAGQLHAGYENHGSLQSYMLKNL